jgi:hypothetical protein
MAAIGLLPGGASTEFQSCRDVSYGGVLCALPALAENGLFCHWETLPVLSGYYTTSQVILLLAYMALCRIKAVEQLPYETPGELGNRSFPSSVRLTRGCWKPCVATWCRGC